jgi:hypothetical protein
MPVTLHAVADQLAVEHAEGRKQRGGAVARVIVSEVPRRPLFIGR